MCFVKPLDIHVIRNCLETMYELLRQTFFRRFRRVSFVPVRIHLFRLFDVYISVYGCSLSYTQFRTNLFEYSVHRIRAGHSLVKQLSKFYETESILNLFFRPEFQFLHEINVLNQKFFTRDVYLLVIDHFSRNRIPIHDTLLFCLRHFISKFLWTHEWNVHYTTECMFLNTTRLGRIKTNVQIECE